MPALRHTFAFIVAAPLAIAPALAQQPDHGAPMPGMNGGAPVVSQADRDMMGAMTTMNRGMSAAPATGDADQDFVAMMIPHHQGAIDMARVELKYGKDPMLRRLATDIVSAQEKEIKEMQSWQARHHRSP